MRPNRRGSVLVVQQYKELNKPVNINATPIQKLLEQGRKSKNETRSANGMLVATISFILSYTLDIFVDPNIQTKFSKSEILK